MIRFSPTPRGTPSGPVVRSARAHDGRLIPTRPAITLRAVVAVMCLGLAAIACEEPTTITDDSELDGPGGAELPEDLTPADSLDPSYVWASAESKAKVTVGGVSYTFEGFAAPVWVEWAQENETEVPGNAWIGECTIHVTDDDLVYVTAGFHRYFDRSKDNVFFMADDGIETFIWSLGDPSSGEEWSAYGSSSLSYLTSGGKGPTDVQWLVVSIDFIGEASENFSGQESIAISTVDCTFWGYRVN